MHNIDVKYLSLRDNIHPEYQTAGASGVDLQASIPETAVLQPGKRLKISTGIAVEIPPGYEGQVRPRSGLADKYGVTILNAPGTIDSDYRGEIAVIVINLGDEPFTINPGDRIAQIVFTPIADARLILESKLSQTPRSQGGFGHTGQ